MIEAEGLQKHFGDVEALAGLDLAVPSGKVLAVLGPNGAGKTTLVRTIATLTRPTAGTLRVVVIFNVLPSGERDQTSFTSSVALPGIPPHGCIVPITKLSP